MRRHMPPIYCVLTDYHAHQFWACPGVERYFDQQLQRGEPVQLSIDLRLQRLVEDEMAAAAKKFSAIGATAIVMDATNGEIIAMGSLPTYDANKAKTITNEALFNRATLGVYEQGSVFKIFNTAMALDSGKVTLTSVFDATSPIKIDHFGPKRSIAIPDIGSATSVTSDDGSSTKPACSGFSPRSTCRYCGTRREATVVDPSAVP